jgi:hypothetical protein
MEMEAEESVSSHHAYATKSINGRNVFTSWTSYDHGIGRWMKLSYRRYKKHLQTTIRCSEGTTLSMSINELVMSGRRIRVNLLVQMGKDLVQMKEGTNYLQTLLPLIVREEKCIVRRVLRRF